MDNYIYISIKEFNFIKKDKYNKNSKLSFVGKEILRHILNLTKEKFNDKLEKNKYGKPIIKNEGIFFNIAHSNNVVVVGVSNNNIGVDIEYIRQFNFEKIKDHFLTEKEYKYICTKNNKLTEYFKMWTIKEAILKLLGVGLTVEPCNIEIDINNFKSATINNKCFNVFTKVCGNYVFSLVVE